METRWYVYILECADGTLYTGVTVDTARRLVEHNESLKGARYTRSRRPVLMKYIETHESRSAATKREAELKQLTRSQKLSLITSSA